MPYVSYRTDFANEVHQLNVSLSKHFYVSKDGELKYQKKPFDLNLDNYKKSSKTHLVHYIIRDHFSNASYAESHPTDDLIPVESFLDRAWSRKENYVFCGLPQYLIVPKTTLKFSPSIVEYLQTENVKVLEATSGFQAGIRILSVWEEEIRFAFVMDEGFHKIKYLKENVLQICRWLNERKYGSQKSNIELWQENIHDLVLPSGNITEKA
jgi:hypothetical protein